MSIKPKLRMLQVLMTDEILRFMRIWVQTILPPLITTTLYFIIFGQIIGEQIDPINGHRFIEYIVPGLVLMTVITNAYANTVSSFYIDKFHLSIEEKLVSPMPNAIILLGFITGGIARGFVVGLLVAAVTTFFVPLTAIHPVSAILIMLLTATVFSLGGFINGVYAKSFDDIAMVPTFVIMPLTYLGGIFYSVRDLPGIWGQVSLFNPIFYMIDAFRSRTLGVSDIEFWYSLALIVGLIVVLATASLRLLNKGIGIRS